MDHCQDVFTLLGLPTTTKTSAEVKLTEDLSVEVEVDDQLLDTLGSSEVIKDYS